MVSSARVGGFQRPRQPRCFDIPARARWSDVELKLQRLAQRAEALDRRDAPAAHVVDQLRRVLPSGVHRRLTSGPAPCFDCPFDLAE